MAGEYKGKTLFYPRDKKMKPTQGLVRAAMFNILADRIHGARVADLFCGAGSLGIEALSHGARSVLFVDAAQEPLRHLKRNLSTLPGEARIRRGDATRILSRLNPAPFDVVFLDPPYGRGFVKPVVEKLIDHNLLAPDGLIVVEHSAREPDFTCPGVELTKRRTYGETIVSILRRTE